MEQFSPCSPPQNPEWMGTSPSQLLGMPATPNPFDSFTPSMTPSPLANFSFQGFQQEITRLTLENMSLKNQLEGLRSSYQAITTEMKILVNHTTTLTENVEKILEAIHAGGTLGNPSETLQTLSKLVHPQYKAKTRDDAKEYKDKGLKYFFAAEYKAFATAQRKTKSDQVGPKLPRAKKGSGTEPYLENLDGTFLSYSRTEEIRAVCVDLFAQIGRLNLAPATWDRGAGADVKLVVYSNLAVLCPEVSYGEGHWKAEMLATKLYPGWIRNRKALLLKSGAVGVKQEDSESVKSDSASEDGGPEDREEESPSQEAEEVVLVGEKRATRDDDDEDITPTSPKRAKVDITTLSPDPITDTTTADGVDTLTPAQADKVPVPKNTLFTRQTVPANTRGTSTAEQLPAGEGENVTEKGAQSVPENSTPPAQSTSNINSAITTAVSPALPAQDVSTAPINPPNNAVVPGGKASSRGWKPSATSTVGLCAIDYVKKNPEVNAQDFAVYWTNLPNTNPTEYQEWVNKSKLAGDSRAAAAQNTNTKKNKKRT
ncbi:hypothetical protein VNI00_016511 [Paramarasmius palmivorus]|uniref:Uncharacterized protein n=1 Tax=Paramarasmius palmivorus TaxID=297713 RepID=A0AAW0BCP4_9AGAR